MTHSKLMGLDLIHERKYIKEKKEKKVSERHIRGSFFITKFETH